MQGTGCRVEIERAAYGLQCTNYWELVRHRRGSGKTGRRPAGNRPAGPTRRVRREIDRRERRESPASRETGLAGYRYGGAEKQEPNIRD